MPNAEDVGAVSIHGGSVMQGNIDMNGKIIYNVPKPNGWGDVANKGYVDDALNNLTADDVDALPIGGGVMNGALNMNSQPLWGLANPTGYDQPVTYRMHLDDLATKAPNIGKGTYTGDVNIVGDNGVPVNSVLFASQAANLPSGHQWGVLETWQPQSGAILQRFSSSDGGVFWREYFNNDISSDWHIGWQRLDNKECAPAGFGLGGEGTYIANCNIFKSGFYRFDVAENAPFAYGTMIVSGRYSNNCNQIAICNAGSDRGVIAVRQYTGSSTDVWEYINPRMENGVEYRTTERYEGKPVYTKKVDTGALTNGGYFTYASDATRAIRSAVTVDNYLLPHYVSGTDFSGQYSKWYDFAGNQFQGFFGSAYSKVIYRIQVWYIK